MHSRTVARLLVTLALVLAPGTVYAQFPSVNVNLPTFIIPASAVTGGGVVTSSQILAPDGSASAPSYSFASAPTTGFYREGGITRLSTGSAEGYRFDAGQLTMIGNTAELRFSADVSLSRGAANRLSLATGDSFDIVGGGGVLSMANVPIISSTAPTVTSAGTSPSVAGTNTASFRVNVGTGGTASTIVMAMPTATTGWNCNAENITAAAANRANQTVKQQSSTTTAVTVQNQTVSTGAALAFTASDIVAFTCFAY